jgi:hypothetical protein
MIAHKIQICSSKIRFATMFVIAAIQMIFALCLIFHKPAKIEKFIEIKIFRNIHQPQYFSSSPE